MCLHAPAFLQTFPKATTIQIKIKNNCCPFTTAHDLCLYMRSFLYVCAYARGMCVHVRALLPGHHSRRHGCNATHSARARSCGARMWRAGARCGTVCGTHV